MLRFYLYSVAFYFLLIIGVELIAGDTINENAAYIYDREKEDKKVSLSSFPSILIVSAIPIIRAIYLAVLILLAVTSPDKDILFEIRYILRNTHIGDDITNKKVSTIKKNNKEEKSNQDNQDNSQDN